MDKGDARAEVAALRALALEFEADARKMRATPRAIANPTNARWADERDQAARACRFMADVLAQDAALVERMAQAMGETPTWLYRTTEKWDKRQSSRDAERDSFRAYARAALAAMLQKEAE